MPAVLVLLQFEVSAMPYEYEEGDDALEKSTQGHTVGAKARELFQEIQEDVARLRAMYDYLQINGNNEYSDTEKHLMSVLKSFDGLKRRYGSAEVLNEIKKTAYTEGQLNNDQIAKARVVLGEAKKNASKDKVGIFSLLRASHSPDSQSIYDTAHDFFSPRNKLEILLDKLDHFEKMHKKENAKKTVGFFSSKPESKTSHPQVSPGIKPSKP